MIAQLNIVPYLRVSKCSSGKVCRKKDVNEPRCTESELACLSQENIELVIE